MQSIRLHLKLCVPCRLEFGTYLCPLEHEIGIRTWNEAPRDRRPIISEGHTKLIQSIINQIGTSYPSEWKPTNLTKFSKDIHHTLDDNLFYYAEGKPNYAWIHTKTGIQLRPAPARCTCLDETHKGFNHRMTHKIRRWMSTKFIR